MQTHEVRVRGNLISFNLFPPEVESILYFQLQEDIKNLKNSDELKKNQSKTKL